MRGSLHTHTSLFTHTHTHTHTQQRRESLLPKKGSTMADSPAARQAKLTLALMSSGAPNVEVLAARNLAELTALAQKYLGAQYADAEPPQASAQDETPPLFASATPEQQQQQPPEGKYVGERNAAGEWEGHGCYTFADGARYEGQFVASQRHGRGTITYVSGSQYEGEWRNGLKHGKGTYRWADGRVEVGLYENEQSVGEGCMWSADSRSAWRIVDDGRYVEEVSLEEARRIADNIGEAVPVSPAKLASARGA